MAVAKGERHVPDWTAMQAAFQGNLVGTALAEGLAVVEGRDAPLVGSFVVVFETVGEAASNVQAMAFDALGGPLGPVRAAGMLRVPLTALMRVFEPTSDGD